MERNEKLEQLADALRAVEELQNNFKTSYRSASDDAIQLSKLDSVTKAVEIISRHSPEPHRSSLQGTMQKCSIYCEAYNLIKQHAITQNNNRMQNKTDYCKILKTLRPVAGSREKYYIDKMLLLYELFN